VAWLKSNIALDGCITSMATLAGGGIGPRYFDQINSRDFAITYQVALDGVGIKNGPQPRPESRARRRGE
jgi:hypothetical protein